MAKRHPLTVIMGEGTIESNADLSGNAGYGFKYSSGKAILATDNACDGVIVEGGAASGDHITAGYGPCYVRAGAAVTAGDDVYTDSTGRFITSASTKNPTGVALQKASAAGDWFLIDFFKKVDETTA